MNGRISLKKLLLMGLGLSGMVGCEEVAVEVVDAAYVDVMPASASLQVGGTQQFSAAVRDGRGNVLGGRIVIWGTSNPSVVAINSSGEALAMSPGAVTITATSEGKSGTATVTVSQVPVATVTVSPASASILVGATQQFTATTKDAGGNVLTGRAVSWSSSNTAVATVNGSTGLVTGVAAGSVTITATSEGKSGTATVTVGQVPVATVTVSPTSASILVGGTQQFTATTRDAGGNVLTGRAVTWSSSNTAVATVNTSTGLVTGVAAGSATITATSEGKSGTATVTVGQVPVATVTVSPTSASILVGATQQFTATTKDAGGNVLTGRAVTWSSSNTGVATVNSSTGLVTGVAAGSVTITATSEGKSGTATVTVSQVPVATVTVSPVSASILVGGTQQFTATTKDAGGNVLTGRTVTWSSSNTAVATVNSSTGLVTGVAAGSVTITATSEGKSGTATVTVSAPPALVRSPATMTFEAVQGGSNPTSKTLSISNGGGGTLGWSVTDNVGWLSLAPTSGTSTGETDSVTVSVNISGLAAGTYNATITITAAAPATDSPQTTAVTLRVAPVHTLTVAKAGTGSGTVTSSPAGIDCGSDCSESYPHGTQVRLTARANAATSTFTGWSGGGCTGTSTTCDVTMDAAKTVTATFTLISRTLTVTKAGTGSGTVTSSPAGISCGADCTEEYPHGTMVTLTATAFAGSVFTGWKGACSDTASTCQVTMDADKTVGATFQLLRTLTVTYSGLGLVGSSPEGIRCGWSGRVQYTACSAAYAYGTAVTLSASANLGHTFTGWSGACTGINPTCTVTMTVNRSVTASFSNSGLGVGFGSDQFSLIPADTFAMGSTNGNSDEQPVHGVDITRAFYIQKTEVTQGQWRAVMGSNPSHFTSCGDQCPVERVSWDEVQEFLNALNVMDPGKNYRLPTEAEWEYACRARTTGDYGGTGVLEDMGWYSGNSGGQTHPVAQKQPNQWGLFDMHGNVAEWVRDWYSSTYYSVSPTNDPQGPTTGTSRVVRGGSWYLSPWYARSANRLNYSPSTRYTAVGFRLVRNQ
jgi:uncharacterized repeat protein (TIGR02543 family)